MALQVDVINRGYSGYNTRWASHLLHSIFPPDQHQIQLVTLFWGANDAALPDRHRCIIRHTQTMVQTKHIAFLTVSSSCGTTHALGDAWRDAELEWHALTAELDCAVM